MSWSNHDALHRHACHAYEDFRELRRDPNNVELWHSLSHHLRHAVFRSGPRSSSQGLPTCERRTLGASTDDRGLKAQHPGDEGDQAAAFVRAGAGRRSRRQMPRIPPGDAAAWGPLEIVSWVSQCGKYISTRPGAKVVTRSEAYLALSKPAARQSRHHFQ
jgi:hypothetical protein